ncbi:MAG: Ig-like domain-containing protein [Burkholderiaceae bacterium]
MTIMQQRGAVLRHARNLTAAVMITALLVACGGSGAGGQGGSLTDSTAASDSVADGSTTVTPEYVKLALLDASQNDVTSSPSVALGSQVTLRVTVRTAAGSAVPNALVRLAQGAPEVVGMLPAVGTALTDSAGVASFQLEGKTVGAGSITATTTVDSTERSASVPISVKAVQSDSSATVSALSIAYQSASIETLKISGAIGESTSTLTFKVVDQAGNPVPNQLVTFSPSVTTGGLSVSPVSAQTSADGTVSTAVTAGTIPTPVRVKATTVDPSGKQYTTQSLQLSISSGNPMQKFFSLSASDLSMDGCDFDGATSTLTARAGDQFGNPVPDGTTINFVTEGGRVGAASVGSCQTSNGVCSVDIESQEYRPKNYVSGKEYNNCRVSVLAYAVGDETFVDENNNGFYDLGESFEDLADAFLNIEPLERSTFLSRSTLSPDELVGDRLIPFVNDGRVAPNSDGVWGNAHVRGALEIVFSSRLVGTPTFTPSTISFAGCVSTQSGVTQSVTVNLRDRNGNPLAVKSVVAAEGIGVSAGAPSPAMVPNTNGIGGSDHLILLTADATRCSGGASQGVAGTLRLKVTPVGGVEQIFTLPVTY